MSPVCVEEFTVIPVRFYESSTTHHLLYVKRHIARSYTDDKPEGLTLFVLNVPSYASEESFKRIFSCVGKVRQVIFEQNPSKKDTLYKNSFKVAYIIYENIDSVLKALTCETLEPLSTPQYPIKTGIKKWTKEYNSSVYDQDKLENEANARIAKYDKAVEKEKKSKTKDAGGWTVVPKKGRNPGLPRVEATGVKLQERTEENLKRTRLPNFYTFQKRESKMNHIVQLRKKYEADKERASKMKQARKFKPF